MDQVATSPPRQGGPSRSAAAIPQATIAVPARTGWWAVGSLSAATFALVTSQLLPIGMLSAMASDLGVGMSAAGTMLILPGATAAIAAPLLMAGARSLDRRTILIGLSMLFLLSNLIVSLSTGLTGVLAGRLFLGIAVGGFWSFAAASGRRLVDEQNGGRATTIIMSGVSAGTVLGVPLGALLGHEVGWHLAFAAMAGISMVVVIVQVALLPPLPATRTVAVREMVGLFTVPRLVVGFVVGALASGGHYVGYTFLEPVLATITHLSGGAISATFAGYGAPVSPAASWRSKGCAGA